MEELDSLTSERIEQVITLNEVTLNADGSHDDEEDVKDFRVWFLLSP